MREARTFVDSHALLRPKQLERLESTKRGACQEHEHLILRHPIAQASREGVSLSLCRQCNAKVIVWFKKGIRKRTLD